MRYKRRASETMPQLSDNIYNVIKSLAEEEGITVSEVTTGPGAPKDANYLGDIIKIKIDGTKDGKDHTMNLIAKLSPQHDVSSAHSVNQLFDKEITAYVKILPMLEKCLESSKDHGSASNFAKFYKGSKVKGEEYIIMEDITTNGYRMCNTKVPLDYKHFSLAMKCLANFHAASFILQKKYHGFYDVFSALVAYEVQYDKIEPGVMEQLFKNMIASVEDKANREKLEKFFGDPSNNIAKYLNPDKTTPYNVFAHGDCWTGNFLFQYEGETVVEMILLDWQTIRLASPVSDLAYFIFLCTDQSLRSEYLPKMLDYYYETLSETLDSAGISSRECYPELVFKDHVKMIMPIGLISATIVLPMLLAEDYQPNPSGGDAGMLLVPRSETYKKRMNEVVSDFVKYEYI